VTRKGVTSHVAASVGFTDIVTGATWKLMSRYTAATYAKVVSNVDPCSHVTSVLSTTSVGLQDIADLSMNVIRTVSFGYRQCVKRI
jgi:hypothetical protein